MTSVTDITVSVLTETAPSPSEFARTVSLPDGDRRGELYSPDIHPAQSIIYEALDSGASSVTIVKPVQDGGSLIAFLAMLHRVVALGQTAIMAYPTLTAARDAWTKKLSPILGAIGKLPAKGGGSGGGAASVIQVPGGGSIILRSAGGRHESGQASATGDVLIPDEVDDWPDMRRVKLIEQRITKSSDPLIVYISTVKRDGEGKDGSHILRLYAAGTQTRLEYPCPHCGHWHLLEWENVRSDGAGIACPGCGVVLSESERLAMLPKRRRVDRAKSEQFSILWTALDSPFPIVINGRKRPIMQGLCDEWAYAEAQAALGDHSFARQFYRDRLCQPYTLDQQQDPDDRETPHDHRTLAGRSERTAWAPVQPNTDEDGRWSRYAAEIPPEVVTTAAAIDVQRNRLYWVLTGFDASGRSYDLAWGIDRSRSGKDKEPPPFAAGELSEVLTRVAEWVRELAGQLWAEGVVDVSDGVTQRECVEWLANTPGWNAIQGCASLPKAKPGLLLHHGPLLAWERRWRPRLGTYHIVTDLAQQRVEGAYRMSPEKPGAALLPGPLRPGDAYLKHLTALGWLKTPSGGRKWGRRAGAGRYDYADARAYAHAVGLYRLERLLADGAEHAEPEPVKPSPAAAPFVDHAPLSSGGSWATDY